MDKSKKRAYEILNLYIDEARKLDFIRSIILVGSLSDDTYTGNPGSDIDLVHIVSNDKDYRYEKESIIRLIDQVENRTDKDIPISKVVFQEQHLKHPYKYDFELKLENKDLIERPIEIFRVLDSGITLMGEDLKASIERPAREDVLESKRLEEEWNESLRKTDPEWYEGYQAMRAHPTIRIMTQIVLTTALSEYFLYTNKSCSSKYHILKNVEENLPDLPYINLLRLCHKNRFNPDQITVTDIKRMNEEYQTVFLNGPKDWANR